VVVVVCGCSCSCGAFSVGGVGGAVDAIGIRGIIRARDSQSSTQKAENRCDQDKIF